MTLHANLGLCVIIVRFSYHANLGPEVGIACKSRVYIYECKYRSQLERSFMENLDQEKRRKKRSGEIEAERDLWGEAGDMHRLFG